MNRPTRPDTSINPQPWHCRHCGTEHGPEVPARPHPTTPGLVCALGVPGTDTVAQPTHRPPPKLRTR